MARIQKKSPKLDLSRYQTLVLDTKENSEYFRLSEIPDTLTSGKNGFLIEGSTFLKPSTEIKIEIVDVDGNTLYVQPGEGIPEYYEGLSKLISIYVYQDTPIGIGKITILGEAESYIDESGIVKPVPDEWKGIYNVKWEKEIKINKNLLNESKVRFVKRPEIIVEELGESFYSKTISNATQTAGTVEGIAVTPALGTDLRNYAGGIVYYIKNESTPFVDGAKDISISGTQIQSASVVEYINQYTLLVKVPHTSSQHIVSDFSNATYGLNYEYISSIAESSLFGSFARFEINNLATFVGDVERVKLYGKSNSISADFNLLYETRIDSQNLLETVVSSSIIDRGFFSASYGDNRTWNTYWSTQSLSGTGQISLDTNDLYKSVKFRNYKVKTNVGNDIRLEKGSEYTVEFYVYYNTPSQIFTSNPNDKLNIYAASGLRQGNGFTPNYYFTTSLDTLNGDNKWRNPIKISYNFIPNVTDDWSINFESINEDTTNGDTFWQVGSVKIYGSNELGYSPDEFGFTIPIQRQIEQETFDFRLEYYDLNNNYVPIQNTATQTFVSGNLTLLGKSLDLNADKLFFNFDGNEVATPDLQTITIFANKSKINGNLLITSQAFDSGGVYIPPASYLGLPYPGRLTSIYETATEFSASLTVADFTGSFYGAPYGPGDINPDRILYIVTENSTQPITKRLSISRLLQSSGSAGTPGADGTDAKTVTLISNIYVIPYDADGNEIGTNNIYLTASQQNHSGVVYYEFLKNDTSKQNTTSQYYTVLSADEPTTASVDVWRVNTREGSTGGTIVSFDTINLFGVKDGSNAYTVVLSNESHTLPVSNAGIVNYTGSGTDIQVYKGANELSGILSGVPILGQFSSSYSVTNGSISVGSISLSGNKIRFNSHSAMSTDNATIAFSVYLEGLSTNFTKIQSLAKSFEGNDGVNGASGSDAKAVSLTSNRYTFTYDQNATLSPLNSQTASLTASASTGSVSWGSNIFYQWLRNGTSQYISTTPNFIITGSSIPGSGVIDIWQVNLLSGSGQTQVAFDNIDVIGLRSGSDAYTVFLTNEAHTFTANEQGVVPTTDYANGATEVRFFRGTQQYTYDQVAPYDTNSYRTGSAIYSFNITASASTVNNDLRLTPIAVTGSTGQLTGSIILPIIDNNTNITFTKTYTFGISKAGLSGSNALAIILNPSNQTVSKSQAGLYQRPVTFSIQVFETGSPLLYTGSNNTLQSGYFTIFAPSTAGTLVPATGSISASIVPSLVTTDAGVSSSFAIQYRDSKGTLSTFISQSHRVAVVTDGLNGASGSDAFAVDLISSRYTFTYDQNGTLTPNSQTASLTASAQTGSGAKPWGSNIFYQFQKNGITQSPTNYSLPFWVVSASADIPGPGGIDIWQVNLLSGSAQTRVAFDNIDLFGLRSGSDAYTIFLTNESHTFTANELGIVPSSEYAGGFTEVRFFRGTQQYTYDQVAPYDTNSYRTGSVTSSFNITASASTVGTDLRLTPIAVTGSTGQLSGSIIIPIIDNNTGLSLTKTYTFSISRAGASGSNAIDIRMTPTSQNVTASLSLGTYSTASRFNVFVSETGSLMRYTTSDPPTVRGTWTLVMSTLGSNGTNNSLANEVSGTITPPLVTALRPFTSSYQVRYLDSKGNLSSYISQSHTINVVSIGQTGPGIVFTGPWTSSRTYQYSEGSVNGRRDVIYETGSGTYYAALQQHVSDGANKPPNASFWQSLGTEDYFVAAKIAIFEESYVQNTLNVGTTNYEAGFSSANITLAGATSNPYITIGQATQGYGLSGIWIGNTFQKPSASFVNSSGDRYLKWDSNTLDIRGIITASAGFISGTFTVGENNGIVLDGTTGNNGRKIYIGAGNYANSDTGFFVSASGQFSLKDKLTWDGNSTLTVNGNINVLGGNAATQTFSQTAANNAALTGSFSASYVSNISSSAVAASVTQSIAIATSSLSQSIQTRLFTDVNGKLLRNATPAGQGLHLGGEFLGYYDGGKWSTFMSNSGDFYLSGSAGYLLWDASDSSLQVSGSGRFTGAILADSGLIGGWNIQGQSLKSSNSSIELSPDASSIILRSGSAFNSQSVVVRGGDETTISTFTGNSFNQVQIALTPDGTGTKTAPFNKSYTDSGTSHTFTVSTIGTYAISAVVSNLTGGTLGTNIVATTTAGFSGNVSISLRLQIASNNTFTNDLTTIGIGSVSFYGVGAQTLTWSPQQTFGYTKYFGATGTWYARLQWLSTLNFTGGSATVDNKTSNVGTLSFGSADPLVELSDGGLQVIRDSSIYLKALKNKGSTAAMLQVGGDITATGNVTAYFGAPSDIRLKENIIPIKSALEKIEKINGVYFDWKDEYIEEKKKNDDFKIDKHDIGIIAQEIEQVLPEIVLERKNGYKTVKYEKIVALLIQSIKELKKEIDILKSSR